MAQIKSAGDIGAGVIGSGWIARLMLNGIDVFVFDPSLDAPENIAYVFLFLGINQIVQVRYGQYQVVARRASANKIQACVRVGRSPNDPAQRHRLNHKVWRGCA